MAHGEDRHDEARPKGPERNYVPIVIAMVAVIVFAAIWAITTMIMT